MDALRKSVGSAGTQKKAAKKTKKASAGQKEDVDAHRRQKPTKDAAAKKPTKGGTAEVGLSNVKHPVTPDERYFVVAGGFGG